MTYNKFTASGLILCVALMSCTVAVAQSYVGDDDALWPLYEKYSDLTDARDNDLRGFRDYSPRYIEARTLQQHAGDEALALGLREALRNQLPPSFALSDDIKLSLGLGAQYRFTDSPSLPVLQVQAITNPFLDKIEGRFQQDGSNAWIEPQAALQLGRWLDLVARPSFRFSSEEVGFQDDTDFEIQRAYAVLHVRAMDLEVGRDSIRWGVGRLGNLLFAGNSEPFNLVRLRNSTPVLMPGILNWMGPTSMEAFATRLDGVQLIPNPYLVGSKVSFKPTRALELGIGYTVEFGGDGAPSNSPLLYFGEFVTDAKNATNRNFIIDARYRFSRLNIEPYAEILVEDCCDEVVVNPRDMQNLFGVHLPSIDGAGKVDMTLEWVRTNQITYRHQTFQSGYELRNHIMGHTLGPDGMGVYGEVRYWANADSRLKLSCAYETRGRRALTLKDQPIVTLVPAYEASESRARAVVAWEHRLPWGRSLWLEAQTGWEHANNFGFLSGVERDNLLAALGLRAKY